MMTSTTNLTTIDGLSSYLKEKGVSYTKVSLLTGGTANFVYRVSLQDGRTVVYKHAASYLHSNKDFPFDPARMDYESQALEILPAPLKTRLPNSIVHAVDKHNYDQPAKLLCIEDGGARNLKDSYSKEDLSIGKVGSELGSWIAAVHECSARISLSPSNQNDLQANNPIGVAIYRYSYNNLANALKDFGHDADYGNFINEEFGSKLATDNECICHGDFWPGNVLVRSRHDGRRSVDLTVVDWEMTRRGTSATDVGQFAAEAFLLDRFRGGKGLLPSFLDAYALARKDSLHLGKCWIKRMAAHWAVHVAFWPTRVPWTDRDGVQKLVDLAVDVLKATVYEEWAALRASELFKNSGAYWDEIWEMRK